MALITCATCRCQEHAELIDAKPSNGDWENGDYDRFECIACYGPGWEPLSDASIAKSVCSHLTHRYAAWREMNERREISVRTTLALLTQQAAERAAARCQPHPLSD